MEVGQLFVNLGVKGTDKTIQAFTSVQAGLGKTASMSLEAKAGILALFYGIEKLFSASMTAGTNMMNLTAVLDENGKALQQWAGAAEMAGVSSQAVFSTFQNLQGLMTKWQRGQGAPPSIGILLGQLGLTPEQFRQDSASLTKTLEHLNEFAQKKGLPAGLRNQVLQDFGAGALIGPMVRGSFNPRQLSSVPYLSQGENKALTGMQETFSRIEIQWQKGLARIITQGGPQLTKDILKISNSLLELVRALSELSKAAHVLDVLSFMIKGLTQLAGVGKDEANLAQKLINPKTREEGKAQIFNFLEAIPGALKLLGQDLVGGNFTTIINLQGTVGPNTLKKMSEAASDGTQRGLNNARKRTK